MSNDSKKKDAFPEIFEDTNYNQYHLVKKLGEGGQGLVYTTQNPNIVIKLALKDQELISKREDSKAFEEYFEIFDTIRILPLPTNVHVATPIALLRDYAGFVMRLMDDMEPLGNLDSLEGVTASQKKFPEWIIGKNEKQQEEKATLEQKRLLGYQKTGSLRRRLELLSRCACILAQLHANGLVYGDLSPNNIYVTDDQEFPQPNVWLIDADNLSMANLDATKGKLIYTPTYGAPEVVQGKCRCSQESDVYSFAIIAFKCLSMVHPFDGQLLNGPESNWDNSQNNDQDVESKAMSGEYPWIYDKEGRNASESGLPRVLILTESLFQLFDRTFSEGRLDAGERPPIYFWPRTFAQAADSTICCPECGMTSYYENFETNCPYCDKPAPALIKILHEGFIVFVHEIKMLDASKTSIPERVFFPFDMKHHGLPVLTIGIKQIGSNKIISLEKGINPASKDIGFSILMNSQTIELQSKNELDVGTKNNLELILSTENRNGEKDTYSFCFERLQCI
jgi:serine/threonine protein kinase